MTDVSIAATIDHCAKGVSAETSYTVLMALQDDSKNVENVAVPPTAPAFSWQADLIGTTIVIVSSINFV